MRDEFNDIYDSLYHGNSAPSTQSIERVWVRNIIEETVKDKSLSRALRPDAKHFLLVNFVEMIIHPLAQSGDYKVIFQGELDSAIREDVGELVQAAQAVQGSGPISASQMLQALAGVWPNLKSNDYAFWDRIYWPNQAENLNE